LLKDILRVKDKVESALQKYPETQDDDKLLWLAVMVMFYDLKLSIGEAGYIKLKEWLLKNNVPASESIRRVRQKFQESGQYVGTKRDKKIEESEVVKNWARILDTPRGKGDSNG